MTKANLTVDNIIENSSLEESVDFIGLPDTENRRGVNAVLERSLVRYSYPGFTRENDRRGQMSRACASFLAI